MIGPALVDSVIGTLEANVGGEPHPVQGVAILGGSMDHIGAVNHHIPGLIIGDQPAALEAISHVYKIGADPASLTHIAIVGTDAFFRRKMGSRILRL